MGPVAWILGGTVLAVAGFVLYGANTKSKVAAADPLTPQPYPTSSLLPIDPLTGKDRGGWDPSVPVYPREWTLDVESRLYEQPTTSSRVMSPTNDLPAGYKLTANAELIGDDGRPWVQVYSGVGWGWIRR